MNNQRIYGFDIIRLISFFAIATFHISLIHYNSADIAIASESIIIRAVEQAARALAFSGFTIAFLTSLLTALSSSSIKTRIRLFSFLIFGWFVFSALMYKPADLLLVWDIYPLLFSGVLVATIIEKFLPKYLPALGIFGFTLLFIPFWDFIQHYEKSPEVSDLVIVLGLAPCKVSGIEWPVLPWIGLPWFGYACGAALRDFLAKNSLTKLNLVKNEGLIWFALLSASTFGLGGFYQIKLGSGFSCEAYRQPPFIWWAHFIWVLFFIRVSIDSRVQNRLAAFATVRGISQLAMSKKFWLAYFLNYLLAYELSWWVRSSGVETTTYNVPVIATIAVCFLPLTEIVTRIVIAVFNRVRKIINK